MAFSVAAFTFLASRFRAETSSCKSLFFLESSRHFLVSLVTCFTSTVIRESDILVWVLLVGLGRAKTSLGVSFKAGSDVEGKKRKRAGALH